MSTRHSRADPLGLTNLICYDVGRRLLKRMDNILDHIWEDRTALEQILLGYICFLILALMVNFTFFYYLVDAYYRAKTLTHLNPEFDVCDTTACRRAAMLTYVVNDSAEPCDDFPVYACSRADTTFPLKSSQHRGGRWENVIRRTQDVITDMMNDYERGTEPLNTSDHTFIFNFYQVCREELQLPRHDAAVKEISDVLHSLSIVKWPMLEVFESVDIYKTLRELHLHYSIDGIIALSVQRNVLKNRKTQPYIVHVEPPVFSFPQWSLLKLPIDSSKVLWQYDSLITSIARIFRPRIELQGIAKEIISLEYYLAKMLILKDGFESYDKRVVELGTLALDNSTVPWHDMVHDMYSGAFGPNNTYDDRYVYVWDMSYLVYINRLLQDTYNTRAVVNYLGWKLVQNLGTLAFRKIFDAFEDAVYGYKSPRTPAEVCGDVVVRLVPNRCARIVLVQRNEESPVSGEMELALRIMKELKTALLMQAEQIPWMDSRTRSRAQVKVEQMEMSFFFQHLVEEEVEIGDSAVGTLQKMYRVGTLGELEQLRATQPSTTVDCRTMSPFSPEVIYIVRGNSLVVPEVMVHGMKRHLGLPPIHHFATLGAMIAVKMIEAIMFEGSYINERLEYEDWYSQESRSNFMGLNDCFADNLDMFAKRKDLIHDDYEDILRQVVLLSGAVTLTYKAYVTFMGKYEEEFIKSNLEGLRVTLNQYFFIHFALNFCPSTTTEYFENFKVSALATHLRILVPLRNCFRMGRDFGCVEYSHMNAPIKCVVV